MRIQYSM